MSDTVFTEGRWWQTTVREHAVSYITKREVVVNTDPTRFLILPERAPGGAGRRALNEWRAYAGALNRDLRPSLHLLALVDRYAAAIDDAMVMGRMFEELFSAEPVWNAGGGFRGQIWRGTDKTRIKELLLAFYRAELLAFPSQGWGMFISAKFSLAGFGPVGPAMDRWVGASIYKPGHSTPVVKRLLLSRVGAREACDLTPAVMLGALLDHGIGSCLARGLWQAQRAERGDAVTHAAEDYGPFGRVAERGRDGTDFAWAAEADLAMVPWCALGTEFLLQVQNSKVAWMTGLNAFFDHLLASPGVSREPAAYFRRDEPPEPLFAHAAPSTFNYVVQFLDWIVDTKFSEEDEDGRPVRLRGVSNPLAKVKGKPQRDETHREAMPTVFVRLAIEILTENDWAWPRAHTADVFRVLNEETDTWEPIWSPVRAVALSTLLRVPLRVFQLRTLDSGEADALSYDPDTGTMVPNDGPLRGRSMGNGRQLGVLQLVGGLDGKPPVLILRVATNKTADIGKDGWQRGYDCPYAPGDIVGALIWLSHWQRTHNSQGRPTSWAEVKEMQRMKTPDELIGMASCFLFRDPLSTRPTEPITHSRLYQLWMQLQAELERRLEASGITGPDGGKIVLVTCWAKGRPTAVRYDLHTTRVTLITSFYADGKVPLEVLMKIAGHATIVMTLYYAKLGVAYMSDEMSMAAMRVQQEESSNWIRHQRDRAFTHLQKAVVWNSEAGLTAFSKGASAALQTMNVGICPVGCSQCERGSMRAPTNGGHPVFVPVPGGRRNCAECRFLITGWPFRQGIQAEFNARSFALAQVTKRRGEMETAHEVLDGERRRSAAEGQPFAHHREWTRAGIDLDQLNAQADQISRELQNLAALDCQIAAIPPNAGEDGAEGKVSLVVGDIPSIQATFEETTEFDLADRICDASVVFPAIVPSEANRFRMRKYDQMLRRNGLPPVFLDMDDEEALRAGNELGTLLRRRAKGRRNFLRLVGGEDTLVKLGIVPADLLSGLEGIVGRKLLAPRNLTLTA